MKNIVVLVLGLLCFNTVFAQHVQKFSSKQQMSHSKVVAALLQQDFNMGASKSTGGVSGERVIAQSTRDSMFNLLDSVYLGYALSRGSKYDYNTMLYAYNYPYNTSPVFNNNGGIFGKPQVLFDTFMHWGIDPNTEWYGYYETAYATYDANYNMTGYLDLYTDSAINPNMRYANKFNAAKNIDTGYACIWSMGTSDSAFKQFYSYNGSNKLVEDSTYELHNGTWRMGSKTYYTYDGSSNLIQIDNYTNDTDTSFLQPLIEQYKYVNTYDGTGRLLTVYSSFFDGTTLSPYIKDTFAYNSTNAYHNSWKEYQYDPINDYWAPMFYMHKVLDATTGLPDTVNINGFDSLLNSWVPQTMDVMTYNSLHDPILLLEYDYNFSYFPARPSYATVYYYNTYVSIAGVKPVQADNSIKIFPNPASNTITVSNLDAGNHPLMSVSLMNSLGQIVSRTNVTSQNELQVSVSGFPAGIYWVIVQDAGGNILHRQAVVKQ